MMRFPTSLPVWIISASVVFCACGRREPTHAGKPLSHWFTEAVEGAAHEQDVQDAITAIEGDAVPFLVGEISAARRAMATRGTNSPSPWLVNPVGTTRVALGVGTVPPGPESRRFHAYQYLEVIARRQRELEESGTPSRKPSITNAFPLVRDALAQPWLREESEALSLIMDAGPLAAEFLPQLVGILTNAPPGDPRLSVVLLSLGNFGAAAVPVIPLLTAVATDARRPTPQRFWAASALGQLGPASRPAAPVIASLLTEASASGRQAVHRAHVRILAQALASVGTTPESAVPVLERVAASTNDWERLPALIALWNHQPEDAALRSVIAASLTSDQPMPALIVLARLGTHAAAFVPAIRALTNHPQPAVRSLAARGLHSLATPTH